MKTPFKKCLLTLSIILTFVLINGQRPIPPNTFYDLRNEEEKQFNPRHLTLGFGIGRFHSEMEEGPVIIFNNTAYCAEGYRNPVDYTHTLVRTQQMKGMHRYPQTSESYSFEKPVEEVTLLAPHMEVILEEHGDYIFIAQARTDILPIYDPNPHNPLGYQERTLTAAQNLILLGYFTQECDDPFHIGWITYRQLEKPELEAIPQLLDYPFSLFEFSLPDFYVYKFDATIYPVEELREFPHFHEFNLVNLREFEEEMFFDIRYATRNNFTETRIYPSDCAYLNEEAAQALKRVNDTLREEGYSLKVMDAYRPLTWQYRFWEEKQDPQYVARPTRGSRHNRGVSVDVLLVTSDGNQVKLPAEYDDFSEKSNVDYEESSEEALQNRDRLIEAMQAEGFNVHSDEFWHYDYGDFTRHPVMDFIPADK